MQGRERDANKLNSGKYWRGKEERRRYEMSGVGMILDEIKKEESLRRWHLVKRGNRRWVKAKVGRLECLLFVFRVLLEASRRGVSTNFRIMWLCHTSGTTSICSAFINNIKKNLPLALIVTNDIWVFFSYFIKK